MLDRQDAPRSRAAARSSPPGEAVGPHQLMARLMGTAQAFPGGLFDCSVSAPSVDSVDTAKHQRLMLGTDPAKEKFVRFGNMPFVELVLGIAG